MKGTCKLCRQEATLKQSHILPKFIYRWITKTAATGKIRGLGNPNKSLQDGLKPYLLCGECEGKFNKYETWFANNFFHPSINELKVSYKYDENLFKFAASIFWRCIITRMDSDDYNDTKFKSTLFSCEEELRNFLYSDQYPLNFDSIYIGMTSYAINPTEELRGVNYYFTRSTDNQIVFTDNKMYYYCVMPYFKFVGKIAGLKDSDFVNSKINAIGGSFRGTDMKMEDEDVSKLITSQIKRANSVILSANQQSLLEGQILANIDKYLDSKSFEAAFLEDIMSKPSE
jgi:hypothetical protein